ncbi:MAG TPA: lipocalin-like domain-containing protein [Thermoanaerobaculia bacterium]|nr:lipocalin-like domain-containing protein [Thermoanaerobaculia bacterium]
MRPGAFARVLLAAIVGGTPAPPPRTPVADASLLAAHPDAKAEWWYYTGHLQTASRREFGFELTFFRARLADGDDLDAAHFALTDVDRRTFAWAEKLHRPFPGIAGADAGRLAVFNEDWEARAEGATHVLRARMPSGSIALRLAPVKPLVRNGPGGISRKGPRPDEYSNYVSFPRLSVSGTLSQGGAPEAVTGIAWFDHEFGPGGLPADLAGWDWFAIQLSDGTETMLYRLRAKSGGDSPFSQGTFVAADGRAFPLAAGDFDVAPAGRWRSPRSGAIYPSGWRVRVPSRGVDVAVTPRLPDQELVTSRSTRVTYWEGACTVSGRAGGAAVTGKSYVELTGYAGTDLP